MCKLGDIIVIDKYYGEDGAELSKHSFVVINDKNGIVLGQKVMPIEKVGLYVPGGTAASCSIC